MSQAPRGHGPSRGAGCSASRLEKYTIWTAIAPRRLHRADVRHPMRLDETTNRGQCAYPPASAANLQATALHPSEPRPGEKVRPHGLRCVSGAGCRGSRSYEMRSVAPVPDWSRITEGLSMGVLSMDDRSCNKNIVSGVDAESAMHRDGNKRNFWSKEERQNLNYIEPHFRLKKSARIVNKIARGKECTLLDIGCGPATLQRLLSPNIQYYGIDIAVYDPAANLIEADFLETPIRFGDRRFDIISAQGIFEYMEDLQSTKLAEMAQLLNENGLAVLSYVNFGHRKPNICWNYSNVQPLEDFRRSLACHFNIDRCFPTSHNWNHGEPGRRLLMAANMHLNSHIPFVSPVLGVEYFFICSPVSRKA